MTIFLYKYSHTNIMDVLTVLMSALCAIPIQFVVMYAVYSIWILPTINKMIADVPVLVRTNIEPFVDEKIGELSRSVKASSARFQRTVNQAKDALALDEDVDLTTDEGIQQAQDKLTQRYGMDIAIQAISQLIQSVESRKTAQNQKEVSNVW